MIKKILLIGTILLSVFLVSCNRNIPKKEQEEIMNFLTRVEITEIDKLENESKDKLRTDIGLTESMETEYGTVIISWDSSKSTSVDSTGHVYRGILGDVEVKLTPRLLLKGRTLIREDSAETMKVLSYPLEDIKIEDIKFDDKTNTIENVTSDIILPKEAIIAEGVSGALLWSFKQESGLWEKEVIIEPNGKLNRPFSTDESFIKVIATPLLDYNGQKVELLGKRVELKVKPNGILDLMKQGEHTFPMIEFSGNETNTKITESFKTPEKWYIGSGVTIDLEWKSNNIVLALVDGIWDISSKINSNLVKLTPTAKYKIEGMEYSEELVDHSVDIFIPGTKLPENIIGRAFTSTATEENIEIYFMDDEDKTVRLSLLSQGMQQSMFGNYSFENSHKIKISFYTREVIKIFGIDTWSYISLAARQLLMNRIDGSEVSFDESLLIDYSQAAIDESYIGKYSAGSFGSLELETGKKSKLKGFNLNVDNASFKVLNNMIILEFEDFNTKMMVTIYFYVYDKDKLSWNQVVFKKDREL